MVLTLVCLLVASIVVYVVLRMRRYPLDRGLRILALLSYPLFLVRRPVLRFANSVIRHMPGGKPLEGMEVRRGDIDGVKVTLYRPEGVGDGDILVYFHGGGFFLEAAPYLRRKCMRYALGAGIPVLAVDYRTSDRFPWPAQLEDAVKVLTHVAPKAKRIAIGGDSAGGMVAQSLATWAGRNGIAIGFLMLVYPVLDRRMETASMKEFTHSPVWNSRLSRRMWSILLSGSSAFENPAELDDFSHQPTTYIEAARFDCLRDEALAFASRLEEHHVSVECHLVEGACHGYDVLESSRTARTMLAQRIEALKKAFS